MGLDEGQQLEERYILLQEISHGRQANTWLAHDTQSSQKVAIKQLALGEVPDWKAVELFERETQTLRSLDHPRIPKHIDDFQLGAETADEFFLVQEYVAGRDLKTMLDEGEIFSEADVLKVIEQVLGILAYLHSKTPAVVHRDVKPSNIIRKDNGELVLVDFGAVQIEQPETVGGSTVVGTTGYMPPEQLMGKAQPGSDLYSIGATAVHCLSRIHPSELEVEKNQLQFKDKIDVTAELEAFIDTLLKPTIEERFKDGSDALQALSEKFDASYESGSSDGGFTVVQDSETKPKYREEAGTNSAGSNELKQNDRRKSESREHDTVNWLNPKTVSIGILELLVNPTKFFSEPARLKKGPTLSFFLLLSGATYLVMVRNVMEIDSQLYSSLDIVAIDALQAFVIYATIFFAVPLAVSWFTEPAKKGVNTGWRKVSVALYYGSLFLLLTYMLGSALEMESMALVLSHVSSVTISGWYTRRACKQLHVQYKNLTTK